MLVSPAPACPAFRCSAPPNPSAGACLSPASSARLCPTQSCLTQPGQWGAHRLDGPPVRVRADAERNDAAHTAGAGAAQRSAADTLSQARRSSHGDNVDRRFGRRCVRCLRHCIAASSRASQTATSSRLGGAQALQCHACIGTRSPCGWARDDPACVMWVWVRRGVGVHYGDDLIEIPSRRPHSCQHVDTGCSTPALLCARRGQPSFGGTTATASITQWHR